MKKAIIIFSILMFVFTKNYSQTTEPLKADAKVEVKYLGTWTPKWFDGDLSPSFITIRKNNESENQEALNAYKKVLNYKKQQANLQPETILNKTDDFEPSVTTTFDKLSNQGTPSDNSIAVSNTGKILVAVNSNIGAFSSSGSTLKSATDLSNFFSNPSNGSLASTNMCDPVVIFDNQANRFIVFAQTCEGSSTTSQVLLAFSTSDDPSGSYNYYVFAGNQSSINNGNAWFDYPKVGYSNHDVFVCGNFFDNNFNYKESGIFQIDKTKCFAGQTLVSGDALIYKGSSIGGNPFTIVPVSNGLQGGYGNNMYLVSSGNSATVNVYEISGAVQSSPSITYQSVSVPSFAQPADAVQKGSSIVLNTGDARGMSAFYNNGMIHFAFHCLGTNDYTEINYVRLTKPNSSWTGTSQRVKISNAECAFPSLTCFSTSGSDQSALVFFDYSSSNDFPGTKAVFISDAGVQSNPITVKAGLKSASSSSIVDQGSTRWGDYTGSSRDFSQSTPTVWGYGMYGNSFNTWNNNVAKITANQWISGTTNVSSEENNVNVFPNPVVDNININIKTKEAGFLNFDIYDIQGKMIKTLFNTQVSKGAHVLTFNKGALSNGAYFIKISLNNKTIKNEKIIVAN